ncbi:hypothetical protein B0H13DRAFT_2648961 [Mycena leptocephala]|nr:hypothetical protein B0H13DRAFT_2648961 [Mycena leptocephala]
MKPLAPRVPGNRGQDRLTGQYTFIQFEWLCQHLRAMSSSCGPEPVLEELHADFFDSAWKASCPCNRYFACYRRILDPTNERCYIDPVCWDDLLLNAVEGYLHMPWGFGWLLHAQAFIFPCLYDSQSDYVRPTLRIPARYRKADRICERVGVPDVMFPDTARYTIYVARLLPAVIQVIVMAALPQIQALAALAGIDAPPQPANPPTLTDIVKAHDYNEQATAQRRAAQTYGGQGPTDNEAGTGLVYEQAVIAANAGIAVAPPWFQQWEQNTFRPAIANVRTELKIHTTQVANSHRGTGHQAAFLIVPLPDGRDPTVAPVLLPVLRNTDDIRALSAQDSTRYCAQYAILDPGNAASRRALIAKHIGCSMFYDFSMYLAPSDRRLIAPPHTCNFESQTCT